MTKNWFLGILVVHLQDPTGGEAEVVVGVGTAQDHDRLRAIVSILSEYLFIFEALLKSIDQTLQFIISLTIVGLNSQMLFI